MGACRRQARSRLAVLLLWACTSRVCSMVTRGVVNIGGDSVEDHWQFLAKFGYGLGRSTWQFKARVKSDSPLQNKVPVRLEYAVDDKWIEATKSATPKCSFPIASKDFRALDLGTEWASGHGGITHNVRSHIWYFGVSRCGRANVTEPVEIEYELVFRQPDGSELGVELRLMPGAVLLAVLCLSGFLIHFAVRCQRFMQSAGTLPPVIVALAVSVLLQWAAQVLHLYHLEVHEKAGISESFSETLADMLFMLSQVASCTLLLAIAEGYTINGNDARSSAPVAAIVAALHVMLVGHGKLQGEHANAHHGMEGGAGVGILAMRLVLFVVFSLRLKALSQTGGFRLEGFLKQFRVAGSVYLLSFPAIYLIGALFAPYLRFPVIHVGQVCFQSASALWLADLFLSRGAYFQVSNLSSSLLPGCSPTSCFKQD